MHFQIQTAFVNYRIVVGYIIKVVFRAKVKGQGVDVWKVGEIY